MAYVRMADNNLVVGSFEQIEEITGDLTAQTANDLTFTGSYVSGTTTHTLVDDIYSKVKLL